jgi:hypothetical protein
MVMLTATENGWGILCLTINYPSIYYPIKKVVTYAGFYAKTKSNCLQNLNNDKQISASLSSDERLNSLL